MTYVYDIIDGVVERIGYIDPKTGRIIKFNKD